MKAVFEKYHCMGNDYLVYDPNKNEMELGPEQVKAVCDRNFGIGSDGILVGPVLGGEKMYVRILIQTEARRRRAETAWGFLPDI